MSSGDLIPSAEIDYGYGIFRMDIVGETAHDLPSLLESVQDLRVRVNTQLTEMCNWESAKADSRDISSVADRGREGKKTRQGKNSGKKMKKLDQVKDECD